MKKAGTAFFNTLQKRGDNLAEREDISRGFNPKHRIIGAIVLVAVAVIVVPLILHNREPAQPPVPVAEMPVPDNKVVTTPVTPELTPPPMPMTPGTEPPAAGAAAPAPNSEAATPTTAPEPAPTESRPTTAPAQTHKPHKPAPPAAIHPGRGWVVQLGAFSRRANALHLKKRLAHRGFRAELDNVRLDGKSGVRVRVGPVRSNSEARALQVRIAKETGIKGVVRAYP